MFSSLKVRISECSFEAFAFWSYILGVAFTALGPVVHYTTWGLTLTALVYGRLRYGSPAFVLPCRKDSRNIFYILLLFLLWTMFAHVFLLDSFYVWGKGASIPLEFMLGLCFAVRLLKTAQDRYRFGIAVVAVNALFALDVMPREYFVILGLNHALNNGNAMALYGVLLMPFLCCFALWYFKNRYIQFLLCIISALTVFLSFSSGGWLAALFEVVPFVFFALRQHKLSLKFMLSTLIVVVLLLAMGDYITHHRILDRFRIELQQDSAYNNMEKLTTNRSYIWEMTSLMIKAHPVTGWGRDTFDTEFREYYEKYGKQLGAPTDEIFIEPHSMYFAWTYAGGFPSLVLFLAAYMLSAVKSFRGAGEEDEYGIPWHLICLLLFIGLAVYGTNGDVFEARRDMGAIFWAAWGLLLAVDEPGVQKVAKI